MSPHVIFWLIAIVVFAIAEAATAGLVSIWFVAGSIGALITALFGAGFWVQVAVFIVLSALTLVLTRPLVKKYISPNKTRTNADRFIGMSGIVTGEINNLSATGTVKVGGIEWTARSESGEIIPIGAQVKGLRIEGVKLIVVPEAAVEPADAEKEKILY